MFPCGVCGQSFTRSDARTRHSRDCGNKIMKYQCPVCLVTFRRSDNCTRHIKLQHAAAAGEVAATSSTSAAPTAATSLGAAAVGQLMPLMPLLVPNPSGGMLKRKGPSAQPPSTTSIECEHSYSRGLRTLPHPFIAAASTTATTPISSIDCDHTYSLGLPAASSSKKSLRECTECAESFGSLSAYRGHLRSQRHLIATATPYLGEAVKVFSSAFKERILSYIISNLASDFEDAENKNDAAIDPTTFIDTNKFIIYHLISEQLLRHKAIKLNFELYANYIKQSVDQGDDIIELKSFATKFEVLAQSSDLEDIFKSLAAKIIEKCESFCRRDSGWSLQKVSHLIINFNRYSPLKGSSHIPLPKSIATKRAVLNILNEDEACFYWSINASLNPAKNNQNRVASYPHYSQSLNLQNLDTPIKLSQISKFESQNNLSVNVYGLEYSAQEKQHNVVGPLHFTKNRAATHINLLLIEDGIKQHYCLITNMSRLIRNQLSARQNAHYLCDGCLTHFRDQAKYERHVSEDCNKISSILPSTDLKKDRNGDMIPGNILRFSNFNSKFKAPFTIYADFESILKPIETCQPDPSSSYTHNTLEHTPYSFAYNIVCSFDSSLNKLVTYTGEDCSKEFVKCITRDCTTLYHSHLKPVVPMADLSPQETRDYNSATICHICSKFLAVEDKVRDHCHLSGKFTGAAHSKCNLNYKVPRFIPIFFHNLSGYDSHLFIRELSAIDGEMDVIPQNMEKYISFSKSIVVDSYSDKKGASHNISLKLRFLDSFRFMNSSLDKLSANLTPGQLVNVRRNYPNDAEFSLLTRKGVFPYNYISSYKVLSENTLPAIEHFYNTLSKAHITPADYEHAKAVWNTFNCTTLQDYSELYLKTDVLLLTDIFETFREVCLSTYTLDPCNYYTVPGLSWDAMLKITGIELELLTDIDQHHFVKRGIRGGISACSLRHARANNKYIPGYDGSKDTTFLAYWDANNLYGAALSDYLPYKDFEWMSEEEISNLDLTNIAEDASEGYILEVDVEYPQGLHDLHNDLPFLAESTIPPNSTSNIPKLITSLTNKSKYIIHYRNLQHCIKHGLILTKIHRVLKFKQLDFIKPYIQLNTAKRQAAANAFEKDFFKLMNNSVFGKTMENTDKRVDVKLVNHWADIGKRRGAESLIARPSFKRRNIITEDFVVIQLNRSRAVYDKPIYIGFAVLELSKLIMYSFYYDFLKPLYGDRVVLVYMDTDSFILYVKTEDLYADMKLHPDRFDTSNFAPDNVYDIKLANKAIPGLMKDENGGKIMYEYAGLRSKMYAYLIELCDSWKKRAKGVKRCVVENDIEGEDYKYCLQNNAVMYRRQELFQSIHHTIFTKSQNKLALSPFDNKRFICAGNVQTLAWGHYRIDQQ